MEDKKILEKYDSALEQYTNEVLPGFWHTLQNRRRPFQPFLEKLFKFYLFCSYLADCKLFANKEEKYPSLQILYVKASLALFGIRNCLQYGLVTEGAILLRSLFEAYLNVKLILQKDTEERLKLFYDFRHVEQWNNLLANKKLLKNGKLTQDAFDKKFTSAHTKDIEENYLLVKSNYNQKQPYHWAWKIFNDEIKGNPSVRFIASKLDLSLDYVQVYTSLSIAVHNSPNLLNLVSTGNIITLNPNFSDSIYHDGCLALLYLSELIEDIAQYLELAEANEISTYLSALTLSAHDEYQGNS